MPKLKADSSEANLFAAKFKALKNISRPALLIFDGIDTQPRPEDDNIIYELLKNNFINIIITTRLTRAFENLPSLKINPLGYQEQLDLFSHHLGFQREDIQDIKSAANILKYGDGNTMYIEHTAKYIKTWKCTFAEALNFLRSDSQVIAIYPADPLTEAFSKILFPGPVSDIRRKVLNSLALLPPEGIPRRLFFDITANQEMQQELINLENEGYVIIEHTLNKNIMRLHAIIRKVILDLFFNKNHNAHSDFIGGLCRVMNNFQANQLNYSVRELYNLTINILNLLNIKKLEQRENFYNFFNKFSSYIEDYELKAIKQILF